MPFTERTSEKLHHMLITDEEQQEKVCIVSFCPSSLIENRSPREKCGPRKKRQEQKALFPQPEWQEGAGSLLLLAAADQTELLACLESALSPNLLAANPSLRLAHSKPETLRSQLATLLFLEAVGLRRTWDLRGYTGQTLARLSGRHRAYGYRHTERFLAELAFVGVDAPLTEALACWTASLWERELQQRGLAVPIDVEDGHRKPSLLMH